MDNRKEEILRISGVNPRKCMRCGKCSGTCPAYGEMEYFYWTYYFTCCAYYICICITICCYWYYYTSCC